jgi:hypothetical protein
MRKAEAVMSEHMPFSRRAHWAEGLYAFKIKCFTPQGSTIEMVLPRVRGELGDAVIDACNAAMGDWHLTVECDQCGTLPAWVTAEPGDRCPLHSMPEPYSDCDGTVVARRTGADEDRPQ